MNFVDKKIFATLFFAIFATVTGLFAYAVVSLGFIFFKDENGLIVLRFFQGIASAMLMPIIQAYIGDITPPGKEGFTMGLLADKISKKWMAVVGGLAMPALMAIAVLKGSETDSMGSVMAILTLAHSLGMLCGSLIGGLMMDLFQLRAAFPLGAAVMMITVAVFLFSTSYRKTISNC